MKNFSLTQSGIVVAVAGTLLVQLGFSDICSNEIVQIAPVLIGGVMSWYGRWRLGGINIFGARV